MEVTPAVGVLLVVTASAALLLTESAHCALALFVALLCLALFTSGRVAARVIRALLLFNLAYFIISLLFQAAVLGAIDPLRTALLFLKLTSLALGSTYVAGFAYPIIVRRACRSWTLVSLLIAARSIVESYSTLADTLDAVRVNYGTAGRLNLRGLRAAAESLPALVLDTVIRRFESAITMLPSATCGTSRALEQPREL